MIFIKNYKEILLQDFIKIKEEINRNTGPSVFIHPQNVEKQYHENLPLDFWLKYGFTFPG